jgi:hypothetical protein
MSLQDYVIETSLLNRNTFWQRKNVAVNNVPLHVTSLFQCNSCYSFR